MKRLLVAGISALLMVVGLSAAAVAETVNPVVTTPADGATVQAPLNAVAVSFDGVEANTSWEINIVREGGCDQRCARTFTHTYSGNESTRGFWVDPAFNINGTYQVNISPVGGGYGTQQHFTLTGGVAYTDPAPERGMPVFITPKGETYEPPAEVSATVDYSNAQVGTYDLYWFRERDRTARYFGQTTTTENTGRVDYYLSEVFQYTDTYYIVADPQFSDDWVKTSFVIDYIYEEPEPEPLTFLNVRQRNANFYPLVRDRYKDYTYLEWEVEGEGYDVYPTYKVTNSSGNVVKSGRPRSAGYGYYNLEWAGRNNDGDKVKPGTYKITFTTADDYGIEASVTRKVEVSTKTVTAKDFITIKGNQFASKAKSGNCRFYKDTYSKELTLDCWGGNYATAKYVAKIPKDAVITRKFINGEVNCCDDGRITKTITRPRPNTVVGVVRVTNWRSYTVWGLNVAYKYQKQM